MTGWAVKARRRGRGSGGERLADVVGLGDIDAPVLPDIEEVEGRQSFGDGKLLLKRWHDGIAFAGGMKF